LIGCLQSMSAQDGTVTPCKAEMTLPLAGGRRPARQGVTAKHWVIASLWSVTSAAEADSLSELAPFCACYCDAVQLGSTIDSRRSSVPTACKGAGRTRAATRGTTMAAGGAGPQECSPARADRKWSCVPEDARSAFAFNRSSTIVVRAATRIRSDAACRSRWRTIGDPSNSAASKLERNASMAASARP
jgi:hypothetical protein